MATVNLTRRGFVTGATTGLVLGFSLPGCGAGLTPLDTTIDLGPVLADGALAEGGRVTGVIPEHLKSRELGHEGVSEMIVVDSMHARKKRMFELSDAFCVLPGGFGTLDEAFEIITWKQLGLHDKPVVLVNLAGYWDPLLGMFEHQIEAGYVLLPERAPLAAGPPDRDPAVPVRPPRRPGRQPVPVPHVDRKAAALRATNQVPLTDRAAGGLVAPPREPSHSNIGKRYSGYRSPTYRTRLSHGTAGAGVHRP